MTKKTVILMMIIIMTMSITFASDLDGGLIETDQNADIYFYQQIDNEISRFVPETISFSTLVYELYEYNDKTDEFEQIHPNMNVIKDYKAADHINYIILGEKVEDAKEEILEGEGLSHIDDLLFPINNFSSMQSPTANIIHFLHPDNPTILFSPIIKPIINGIVGPEIFISPQQNEMHITVNENFEVINTSVSSPVVTVSPETIETIETVDTVEKTETKTKETTETTETTKATKATKTTKTTQKGHIYVYLLALIGISIVTIIRLKSPIILIEKYKKETTYTLLDKDEIRVTLKDKTKLTIYKNKPISLNQKQKIRKSFLLYRIRKNG